MRIRQTILCSAFICTAPLLQAATVTFDSDLFLAQLAADDRADFASYSFTQTTADATFELTATALDSVESNAYVGRMNGGALSVSTELGLNDGRIRVNQGFLIEIAITDGAENIESISFASAGLLWTSSSSDVRAYSFTDHNAESSGTLTGPYTGNLVTAAMLTSVNASIDLTSTTSDLASWSLTIDNENTSVSALDSVNFEYTLAAPIPEPSTAGLAALALIGGVSLRRRKM
ncbi:PEP-CTERM sorting domain-containing protein [Persicirhabdus sediminis]|uniref:PEP-CTERM sorting domain-containing protein n=1 Tax=Persicirhabdus sediminis TaxID=454144 RepID=A0A8J7MEG4_9BACT|nr:PEP-CTERM sorting domain-containing protein [Persicirhabdus sediminis]MBK1791897.1 PEP-CTERM sorting domain-containing protein [Persicirhabdus sediminis]